MKNGLAEEYTEILSIELVGLLSPVLRQRKEYLEQRLTENELFSAKINVFKYFD